MSKNRTDSDASPTPGVNPYLAVVLAWLVPGLGHAYGGHRHRALAFFALIVGCLVVGWQLDGALTWQFSGSPLLTLKTAGTLGAGLPMLLLRFGIGHVGDPTGTGWDYGGVFIVTAGVMNLLLAVEAWDLAQGRLQPIDEDADDPAEEEEKPA